MHLYKVVILSYGTSKIDTIAQSMTYCFNSGPLRILTNEISIHKQLTI